MHTAQVTTVINQKGGVGKSTTASALGSGLALRGFRVLYIDLDAQGNLSHSLKALGRSRTSLEVLTGTATATEAITKTDAGEVIASSPTLAAADTILTGTGREYRLKEALEPLLRRYDHIIVDTPPSLGILTINALTACTGAIVPAQADIYSLQGIASLAETVNSIRRYTNPSLKILGILLTRHNERTILTQDLTATLEGMAAQLDTTVYKRRIREAIAVKEAQAVQESLLTYAPTSNVAKDYSGFIDEYLQQIQQEGKGE